MIINNQEKLEYIKSIYKDLEKTEVVVLEGNTGIGKTTVISNFVDSINELNINELPIEIHYNKESFALWGILHALKSFIAMNNKAEQLYISLDADFTIGTDVVLSKDGLNFYENLMKALLDILNYLKKPVLIFFEIQHYPEYLFSFIHDFYNAYKKLYPSKPLLIIMEFDNDSNNLQVNKFFTNFSHQIRYLKFEPWSKLALEALLNQQFDNNLQISCSTLDYLLDSVFQNPYHLKNVIEYLKRQNIIQKTEYGWDCKPFEKGLLLQQLGAYIRQRYELLDPVLKSVLQRSSIIGYEFDCNLLENPLRVTQAHHRLIQIEQVSQLIHKIAGTQYIFENQEAQLSIQNLILIEEQHEWNIVIADYFYQIYQANQTKRNIAEHVNILMKAIFYYEQAGEYQKTLSLNQRLIPLLMSIMDYNNALKVIEKAKQLGQKLNMSSEKLLYLEYQTAECYRYLFEYYKAAPFYQKYLNSDSLNLYENQRVRYIYALVLYNTGDMSGTHDILCRLHDELVSQIKAEKASLLVKVLALLSDLSETCNSSVLKEMYYNRALEISKKYKLIEEYYILLKRANTVHYGKNAISLMLAAKDYYKKQGNKKEYAMVLHNIGTEMLYHGEMHEAEEHLIESYKILSGFASKGMHYVTNSLGIYYGYAKSDYKTALEYFQVSYSDEYESFSKIGVLHNQAACYRKLGNFKESERLLDHIDEMLLAPENSNFSIFKAYILLSRALLAYEMNQTESALNLFKQYIHEYHQANHHRYIFAVQYIIKLSKQLRKSIPIEIVEHENAISEAAKLLFSQGTVLCRFIFGQ